jgi:shikimate kinase
MNIYLIGFMGCGKTTLGKKIAKKTNNLFLDMDAEIEKNTQLSIADIFLQHGESYFRELENKLLTTIEAKNYIVSTGGGVPCFLNNMEIMKASGLTVFINLPPKTLVSRLLNEKDKRPLIQNTAPENLLTEIEERLNQRLPYYQQAHIIFNPLQQSEEELIEQIMLWAQQKK